jgi:hypothetical protein
MVAAATLPRNTKLTSTLDQINLRMGKICYQAGKRWGRAELENEDWEQESGVYDTVDGVADSPLSPVPDGHFSTSLAQTRRCTF